MFEFTIRKNSLLAPLMTVSGAVEKKQTLPVLSNILIRLDNNIVTLDATDTEIEMVARVECESSEGQGETTVPAKKLIDLCRSFSDDAILNFGVKEEKVILKQGRSRFTLSILPADEFPNIEDEQKIIEFNVERQPLLQLLQSIHFAMAQQDVRYYLNGLLLEMNQDNLIAVATDGHRMALNKLSVSEKFEPYKVIIPRKGIFELIRLLSNSEDESVLFALSSNHLYLNTEKLRFISKLVEGRYPAYSKLIPRNNDKEVVVARDVLKTTLARVSILANEKHRGVILAMTPCNLTLVANNQEQEEAEESIEVDTLGDDIKISLNAAYLMDVLNNIDSEQVKLSFSQPNSSILIESGSNSSECQYIIMPMKI